MSFPFEFWVYFISYFKLLGWMTAANTQQLKQQIVKPRLKIVSSKNTYRMKVYAVPLTYKYTKNEGEISHYNDIFLHKNFI